MSRKITMQAVDAFITGKSHFNNSNTQVRTDIIGDVKLLLHDNMIAVKHANGEIFITNAGWFSNTTKERLNGLPNVSISQRAGKWYLNGNEWNGELTKVN